MAKKKQDKGLADPSKLDAFTKKPKESRSGTAQGGEELLQVIIETPKGSRNKYSYALEERIFKLKAALPAGMLFPYDFGFLPGTIADDGDPLDVLVLMDEPAFPGCAVMARLIGVIEGEQTANGKTVRNDRLIAVAETAQMHAHLESLKDLQKQSLAEIKEFFVNYNRLQGKKFKLMKYEDAAAARKLIVKAQKSSK